MLVIAEACAEDGVGADVTGAGHTAERQRCEFRGLYVVEEFLWGSKYLLEKLPVMECG